MLGFISSNTHECHGLWHLDLRGNAATFVVAEMTGVTNAKSVGS